MNYKAIIFDLDGTLLDSIQDIANFGNRLLTEYGFPTHPLERYIDFVGDGAQKLIERALPTDIDENTFDRFLKEYLFIYSHKEHTKSKPYQGITDLLDYLQNKSIKMSVLTNKPQAVALDSMRNYFQTWNFDIVQGQQDGIKTKPDPTYALKIAAHYQLKPEEIIFIGDSAVDVKTGKTAGMLTIAIVAGYEKEKNLIREKPDFLVKRHSDIITLLKTL